MIAAGVIAGTVRDLERKRTFIINGNRFVATPGEMLGPVAHLVRAWMRSEKGALPNGGGWFDQTNGFIEACDIIENEIGEIREKKRKERAKK